MIAYPFNDIFRLQFSIVNDEAFLSKNEEILQPD